MAATGALGFGLALRLGLAGVPIVIGSRDGNRAHEAAERASSQVPDGSFTGLENAEAVKDAEIVILSVPFRNQSETLTNLKGALEPGQLLVDATVPLAAAVSGKATRTLGVWQGSAAQQAQEMAPDGVHVVSAFHTVSAALLSDLDHELDEDVLICGDRREDKAKLAELVDAISGLRPVDCGPLEMARIVEQLTAADHLDQRAQQGPSRDQDHRAERALSGPVVVLAGGTGGAKLARGMLDVAGGDSLVVIANTGDDIEIYGAYVSPDPDLVTFWLADRIDERGWGLAGDTFHVMDGLRRLNVDVWFNLGDEDLAIGIERARRLDHGERLTDAQAAIAKAIRRPRPGPPDERLPRANPGHGRRPLVAVSGVHDQSRR